MEREQTEQLMLRSFPPERVFWGRKATNRASAGNGATMEWPKHQDHSWFWYPSLRREVLLTVKKRPT